MLSRGGRWVSAFLAMPLVVAMLALAARNGDGNGAGETPTGEEHTDADGEGEANAYLEAAPKEALTLIEMTSFAYTPSVI